jgi:hypothetical protein
MSAESVAAPPSSARAYDSFEPPEEWYVAGLLAAAPAGVAE